MQQRAPIGAILQQMGVVTFEQIEEALEYQQRDGCKIGEALVKLGYAQPEDVSQALAKQYHLPYIDLDSIDIPENIIALLTPEVALDNKVIPVRMKERSIVIALSDPLDFVTADNVRFILNREIETVLASTDAVERALSKYYRAQKDLEEELEKLEDTSDIELRGEDYGDAGAVEGDDAPVIRLVQALITEAIKQKASDIHVEPFEKVLRVRYRIDGMLVEQDSPPKRLQGAVISRIKIMARMDMAEKRRPQDGSIKMRLLGREFDFRVSSLPSTHGESVVLRILDKEEGLVPLDVLGFHESDFARFRKLIKRPNGIFLVTGPTGSGKTTTLYAALKELNKPNVKIITAEDPIEYHLSGVNQCMVNRRVGLTFAKIIRSMLRQAPNIILVGEIRDRETADTAIQAALTGHLVFSTLHTNDAPSALPRLIDLGIKPFLVSSAIIGVMAQRLLRLLCNSCKEAYDPPESELTAVGLSPKDMKGGKVYRAAGCPDCGYRGYRGRKGVFELMIMTSELRDMVFRGADASAIRSEAHGQGMITLQEDAVRKVLSGMTSIQEVLRVTAAQEFFK
jgi:type IV pilus assembly protein PilB